MKKDTMQNLWSSKTQGAILGEVSFGKVLYKCPTKFGSLEDILSLLDFKTQVHRTSVQSKGHT